MLLICNQFQSTHTSYHSPVLKVLAFSIGIFLSTLQNPWFITLACSRNQHSVKEHCVLAEHNLEHTFPVTEQVYWLYFAFLVGSFSSYNSVINYLTCLRQVNLYLGANVHFFASPEVKFLKQASKCVLAKSPARKLPITVDILLAIFKCLDFRLPLHVSMWAVFLVAFFSL